ncbi:MAG: transposase, partial [Desulfofustis sp.]|nr:transposase [Desulfofustis sp.]
MKLKEKIPWLMGRLQRTLFPSLDACCAAPLTTQEKHLVKVLEIIEVENHVSKSRQWTGRPPAERKAIARSYVAKALFRYPHTRNLIHELQARPNLRLICGFPPSQRLSSESTFSRAFAEFAVQGLGQIVHDSMVS